jgi:G:T/U-mismatch repair DNA glycosylase
MSDSTGNQEKIKEIHPDWYRDVFPMYYLILGSFPPHSKRWDYPFYYPNKINRFWKILAEIAKVNLTVPITSEKNAVDERFSIMQKLNTGVQNLGKKILRK